MGKFIYLFSNNHVIPIKLRIIFHKLSCLVYKINSHNKITNDHFNLLIF